MNDAGILKVATIDQWDEFIATNRGRKIWVLKHSLVCPLSREGLREFERFVQTAASEAPGQAVFAVIEIQNARELSAEISRRTGVRHESPQALLMTDGQVRWNASHWQITASALRGASQAIDVAVGAECE